MIAGIVLAAGRSQRMGRPKALLEAGGETFLDRAIRTLQAGGCEEIVAVLSPDEPALAGWKPSAGARSTWGGSGPHTEPIDSLRAGLRALSGVVEAAVVLPVDHPRVESTTVRGLIEAFRNGGAPIVLPVFKGRRGHPVLFCAAAFDELLAGRAPEGARSVVHAHEDELEEVDVNDRGVLIGVDTPGDYEEHFGGRSS